jgi:hypothetical protein
MTAEERAQLTMSLLMSIDGSLRKLIAIAENKPAASAPAAAVATVAPDADLDGQYGDERIKFDPRNWGGESFKGTTMSACPADYLDCLATSFDWFARKNADNGDEKKAGYDRRSAARARGWAQRKRTGWEPKAAPPAADDFGSDGDSPF